MFTFLSDGHDVLRGAPLTPFLAFFVYVWVVWAAKALAARRYRPSTAAHGRLTTTVIVPVYSEPEEIFRRALASVIANGPTEVIVVVDGGDPGLVRIASDYTNRVLQIPKSGKRAAIAAGLQVSDPATDVVLVLDSDTTWTPGMLGEL